MKLTKQQNPVTGLALTAFVFLATMSAAIMLSGAAHAKDTPKAEPLEFEPIQKAAAKLNGIVIGSIQASGSAGTDGANANIGRAASGLKDDLKNLRCNNQAAADTALKTVLVVLSATSAQPGNSNISPARISPEKLIATKKANCRDGKLVVDITFVKLDTLLKKKR
jgi:hypothetical protein